MSTSSQPGSVNKRFPLAQWKPFEGFPRESIEKMLREWDEACQQLRHVRRQREDMFPSATETRLDKRVARMERGIVSFLFRETFGYHGRHPKNPLPVTNRS